MDDRTTLMSARALESGTQIMWYTVREVLGQGGFGITYLAHDNNLDREVAIKEYLPTSFAFRNQDFSVKPITAEQGGNFAWGLDSFLKEAKTLARFSHDNIVRVHSVFEQNNTAYMVMEYEQGDSLLALFKQAQHLDQGFLERTFFPIFEGLERIHELGFIHRDIKPGNIYLRSNGSPVLLDFGSARQTSQQQTGEMTTLVSQGYTPLEQYSSNYGDQGPWTDIYSLAATLYQGVTGAKPDEALSRSACRLRSKPDTVQALSSQQYPAFTQTFLDAVLSGLSLEPEMRPQNLSLWRDQFTSGVTALYDESAGFTQMENDDRTRIQPRPAAHPSEAMQGNTSAHHFTNAPNMHNTGGHNTHNTNAPNTQNSGTQGVHNANAHNTSAHNTIDELDWSDSMAKEAPADIPVLPTQQPNKPLQDNKKSSNGKMFATVGSLVLAGAGIAIAGYMFFGKGLGSDTQIDSALLQSLPVPKMALPISSPKEQVMEQLDQMQILASMYTTAYESQPGEPELINGISELSAELGSMAQQWNADTHASLIKKLVQVSRTLPETAHSHQGVLGLINSSEQLSNEQQVIQLLNAGQYLKPAGQSVIDKINLLSTADANSVRSTEAWSNMMNKLKMTVVDSIKASDFDAAALQLEAALRLDPKDAQINMLTSHLALR